MHTRLYAGSPLKQDSFERAQALGLEGKTGGTERAKQHASFSVRSLPVKRNGTEMERFLTPTVCTIYSTRQKKVAYTVYRFSVFRVIPFYRFTVPFTVLPFYRSKYRLSRERGAPKAVIAGEYLEVLKLGRCSATILMVDMHAEPFGEPPIRASGPSAATRAARWFNKSQLGVPLCREFIHAHAQELPCGRTI